MSVAPELSKPLEAFTDSGNTHHDGTEKEALDRDTKSVLDGKAKLVDGHRLSMVCGVANSSSEEKSSIEEVFKEAPSEKNCSADEEELQERGKGRKKLLSFSDEVQHQEQQVGNKVEQVEEVRRRKSSEMRREVEAEKEEEGRKRREDRRRRSCQVNTGEFAEGTIIEKYQVYTICCTVQMIMY